MGDAGVLGQLDSRSSAISMLIGAISTSSHGALFALSLRPSRSVYISASGTDVTRTMLDCHEFRISLAPIYIYNARRFHRVSTGNL